MASPIPATACRRPVRPHGSQLMEFGPPQASPNHSNGNRTDANSRTIHDKSVLGRAFLRTWGAAGSQKAPDNKKYKQSLEKCGVVDPPGPRFDDFSMIFVSWACKWTH